MRSKIFQVLLLIVVIPFIAWSIFEKCEITMAQFDQVMQIKHSQHPMVGAAVAVALDDRKITQAEYAVIMQIADKYRPGATTVIFED